MGSIGEGIHAPSVVDTAVVDYAMTLALAVLVTYTTKVPLVLTTIACMLLSIGAHAALGIDTRTMRWIRAHL
jgi:hypothetical protein